MLTDHTAVCFGTRNIPLVTKQLPYLRSPYTIIFHQSCLNAGSQLMSNFGHSEANSQTSICKNQSCVQLYNGRKMARTDQYYCMQKRLSNFSVIHVAIYIFERFTCTDY